jgi:hypothetical protein
MLRRRGGEKSARRARRRSSDDDVGGFNRGIMMVLLLLLMVFSAQGPLCIDLQSGDTVREGQETTYEGELKSNPT